MALEKYDCPVCGAKNSLAPNAEGLQVCRSCGYVLGPIVVAGFKAVKSAIAAAPISGPTDFSWRDATGRITPVFKLYQALNRAGRRLEAEIDKAAALLFVACRMEGVYNDDLFVEMYDAKKLRRKIVEVQRMTGAAAPPPSPKQVIYKVLASAGASDASIARDAWRCSRSSRR